jgi:hypothetical protein
MRWQMMSQTVRRRVARPARSSCVGCAVVCFEWAGSSAWTAQLSWGSAKSVPAAGCADAMAPMSSAWSVMWLGSPAA